MPRSARPLAVPALALLAASGLLLAACGVSFGSSDKSTDIFEALRVFREPNGGYNMVLQLDYRQPYTVDVGVSCYLKQNGQRLEELGNLKVPANPRGGQVGDVTPVPGNFTTQFPGPPPGHYRVTCLTPDDENNAISADFDYP